MPSPSGSKGPSLQAMRGFFINIASFNETRFGFRDLAKGTIDIAVVTVSAKFDFGSATFAEEKP
jgi:hypothetical protein